MLIDRNSYGKAFANYLRKGTPIARSLKQDHPTTHYIWRTAGDGKVRPSHAANDGQVFAWDRPPPTGNPGEDYGCRCRAEPFDSTSEEFVSITLAPILEEEVAWTSADFVDHYFNGGGRSATVGETGHLEEIVAEYMNQMGEDLRNQIAEFVRGSGGETFSDDFVNTYQMRAIVFSVGRTTIGGTFSGRTTRAGGSFVFSGQISFYLSDEFVDPLDIGVEILDLGETIYDNIHRPFDDYLRGRVGHPQDLGLQTGDPYGISDEWSALLEGRILADPLKSRFAQRKKSASTLG